MTLDPDPLYVPELEAPPAHRSYGWVPVLIVLAVTAAAIAWRLFR